jgi:hypothetical protein
MSVMWSLEGDQAFIEEEKGFSEESIHVLDLDR